MAAAADVTATMIEAEVDATMTAEVAMTIAATNSDVWCLIELSLGRMLLSKTFMI